MNGHWKILTGWAALLVGGMAGFRLCAESTQHVSLSVSDSIVIRSEPVAEHFARIESDELSLVIANNQAFGPKHRAGYNGVAELIQKNDDHSLFVPTVSGLNLEHIFSGDAESYGWHIFEPRHAPMQLTRRSPTKIELNQESTEHWPLRSRMTYEVEGDAINFTYCGTPLADAWNKHGYIGLFFASYILQPDDMSLRFIGHVHPGLGDTRAQWIKNLPEQHGWAANHIPSGSTWDLPIDDGCELVLVSGISDYEYLYPFYFGVSGENAFVMMFERPRDGSEIRFAQSPSGGGKGNPAWDFIYLQRGYELNREFSFRARAVFCKFRDTEQIIELYEQWSGERVVRPDEGKTAEQPSAN